MKHAPFELYSAPAKWNSIQVFTRVPFGHQSSIEFNQLTSTFERAQIGTEVDAISLQFFNLQKDKTVDQIFTHNKTYF